MQADLLRFRSTCALKLPVAAGRRVAKGTISASAWSCNPAINGFTETNRYILGPNGEQMTEMAVSGGAETWVHTNVPAGGLVATYMNDGEGPHFRIADWLGTTRVQTNSAGSTELLCQSLPFGDPATPCTVAPGTEQFFTGYERDPESGNDFAQARHYASGVGRFLSPDPSGLAYADPANPQSFNLYSYVGNNPLKFVDPTGLHFECTTTTIEYTDINGTQQLSSIQNCSWVDDGIDPREYQTTFGTSLAPAQDITGMSRVAAAHAPSKGQKKTPAQCAGGALNKNKVALALDTASLAGDAFGPEEQYAKLTVGLTLSTASMINSAAHQDMPGTGLGMASYLKAPTELAARSAGWGWAKWIPFAGAVMDVASAYNDGSQAYSDYGSCMAGH